MAATQYLQTLRNCTVNPNLIMNSGKRSEYIEKLAEFKDHTRLLIVNERNEWATPFEMVYDFILGDNFYSYEMSDSIFDGWFDSIGIACDCHPTFKKYCVIEFAKGLKPK